MHAELVEFNEILQKKLANRDSRIIAMTNQIASLSGRVYYIILCGYLF